MNTKTSMYRTATIFAIAMMLFAALPVAPAGAVSLDITSVATGTWEATAWPNTQRSGTISVPLGSTTVTVIGGGTLTVSNPATVFSTLTVDGTLTGMDDIAFGALTVNSSGVVDAGGNGAYAASSLTINSGGTFNAARDFTVSGATLIAGTISFSSTSL